MSKITDADSVPSLAFLASGWLVQFLLRWPRFPHRKQMRVWGLPPFPPSFPPGGGAEPDDVPGPGINVISGRGDLLGTLFDLDDLQGSVGEGILAPSLPGSGP